MPLELNNEQTQIYKPLKVSKVKNIVDTDVIVPDTKPDVADILQVNALASISEKYLQKDMITVSGFIDYTVLYCTDDSRDGIKNILFRTPFTEQVEAAGADNSAYNYILSDISHIEYSIKNSRKISIKSVMSFETGVVGNYSFTAAVNSLSTINTPSRTEEIKVFNLTVCNDGKFSVCEDLNITCSQDEQIEIVKTDCKISPYELKTMNNKIVAKGAVFADIMYTRDGDICHTECEIPFTEVIDVDELSPDMHTEINYNLSCAECQNRWEEDECTLSFQADVSYLIKGYDDARYEIMTDVYSPDYYLSTEEHKVNYNSLEDVVAKNYSVNNSVFLSDNKPSIMKIYNLIVKPVCNNQVVNENFLLSEGYIDAKILYLSDSEEQPVCSYEAKIPFLLKTESDSIDPECFAETDIVLEHAGYILKSENEVEIRSTLALKTKILKSSEKTIISNVEIDESNPINKTNQPGITIYFADENEKLWDIAKKFNTTEDEIADINGIKKDECLSYRQQLMIPKRLHA